MSTKVAPKIKSSPNAKLVAQDVMAAVSKGQKVNLYQIMVRRGYSLKSARAYKATKTQTFKREMSTVVGMMEKIRRDALESLQNKDLNKQGVFGLSLLVKNLTHDIQLLKGRATARIDSHHIAEERKTFLLGIMDLHDHTT